MFGVIVCPKCNRARGIDLSAAEATCHSCGKGMKVSRAKIYFKTDFQSELVEAVRKMNEQLAVGIESPTPMKRKRKKPDFHERLLVEAKKVKGSEDRLRFIVERLTNDLSDFGADDLARVVKDFDETDVDELLDMMLNCGIIYEPTPGRYRST